MNNKLYIDLLMIFHTYLKPIIIEFNNGLKVKCKSFTGIYETDTVPSDDDYIGEYAAAVEDVVILNNGNDNTVKISNNCIEISLINIPEKIFTEDGALLWKRPSNLRLI